MCSPWSFKIHECRYWKYSYLYVYISQQVNSFRSGFQCFINYNINMSCQLHTTLMKMITESICFISFMCGTITSKGILFEVTSGFIFSVDQSAVSLLNLWLSKHSICQEQFTDFSIYFTAIGLVK